MSQLTITCRYCNNTSCPQVLDLGSQSLANSFLPSEPSENRLNEEGKYPLDLYFCDSCGLVQIGTVVDPELLFRDYIYFSSTSDVIHKHGKYLANKFKAHFDLNSNSLIVEIASNDGTVLQYFKKQDLKVLGVEPAKNIAKVAIENGIDTYMEFFDESTSTILEKKYGKADIILARNVFAHIPEIHGFVKGLKHFIAPEGVIAIEAPHLMELIKNTQFDTIYHEHVTYLSLRAMQNLFKQFGMRIFDVEFSELNGGSLIYYICNESSNNHITTSEVEKYQNIEEKEGLYMLDTYLEFANRTLKIKSELVKLINNLKSDKKSIAGYGASAKGMVLLMYSELDSETIDFIVDKSEAKQDKLTPGSHIPVYSPEKLVELKPDYTLLLAWNLAEEIIKQQSEYLERGGKFIIPIPFPKIVSKNDYN